MLCLLSKNDAKYLPQFLSQMEKLDYPIEKLRWVWIYGRSIDFTLDIILNFHQKHSYKFDVYEEPYAKRQINNALYLADLCNEFKKLYKDEDYVLFADVDLVKIPPNTLKELLKVKKDIVAPYPYTKGKDQFYDTYVFRYKGQKYERIEENGKVYGPLNPIFKDSKKPIKLDSVGTMVLIRGEVFKKIDWDNPTPHYQFCKNARKAGYTVWALPYVRIEHEDVIKFGEYHMPLEYFVQQGIIPASELEKMRE